MKKGFTLIELLAVIVILAIIALIATPLILGVIDTAKKGAVKSAANGIINVVENYYASAQLKNETPKTTFDDLKNDTLLEYKGSKLDSGELFIHNDGSISIAIEKDGWCAKKGFSDKEVTVSKSTICKAEGGTTYNIGDEITFKNGDIYNVIEVGNETLTLLSRESIGTLFFDKYDETKKFETDDYCAYTDGSGSLETSGSCNAYKATDNFVNGAKTEIVRNNTI